MTTSLKRAGTVLLSVLLLCTLALSAGAASKLRVGVKFWKTGSDKESMANSGIDTSREASLPRQSNGTYTLTLPIQQVSKMGVTGYLTGLTIGDVTYNGTVTGDVTKDTGVLTIKNLPASVLTGSDVNKALTVTCSAEKGHGMAVKIQLNRSSLLDGLVISRAVIEILGVNVGTELDIGDAGAQGRAELRIGGYDSWVAFGGAAACGRGDAPQGGEEADQHCQ